MDFKMDNKSIFENISNMETFALTIYGEARGEPIEGQIAVANVIYNRSENNNYKEVCLKPRQFSCWNKFDPNFPMLLEMGEKLILGTEINDMYFEQCKYIAIGIDQRKILDNTHGSENYLTKHLFYSDRKPEWAKNVKSFMELGSQVFFTA